MIRLALAIGIFLFANIMKVITLVLRFKWIKDDCFYYTIAKYSGTVTYYMTFWDYVMDVQTSEYEYKLKKEK
jgi:hypothetical protein